MRLHEMIVMRNLQKIKYFAKCAINLFCFDLLWGIMLFWFYPADQYPVGMQYCLNIEKKNIMFLSNSLGSYL